MKSLKITTRGITAVIAILMILAGSSNVFAQHQQPSGESLRDTAQVQQEINQDNDKEYKDEVSAEEVNTEVASAIVESYPGYGIVKIYSAKDGSYKVKLENETEKITAYYSANGELLKELDGEDINANK